MKLLTALVLLAATVTLRAEPEYPKMGPDLYDVQADGTAQIAAAVAQAKAGHKHVLVKLGANWCIWCRRLTHVLETAGQRHSAPEGPAPRRSVTRTLVSTGSVVPGPSERARSGVRGEGRH